MSWYDEFGSATISGNGGSSSHETIKSRVVVLGSATILGNGGTSSTSSPDGSGQAVECNLRFPGQYFDAETGLHYNFHRYYDPELGRYITEDPIRDGLNWYAYANNNPLSSIDPLGLYSPAGIADSLDAKLDAWGLSNTFNDNMMSDGAVGTLRDLAKVGTNVLRFGTGLAAFVDAWGNPCISGWDKAMFLFEDFERFGMITGLGGGAGTIGKTLLRGKKPLQQFLGSIGKSNTQMIRLKSGAQVPASQFGGGWWNVADDGAKKTHKHIRQNIKDINAVDDINSHLGKGKQTDINLFTGKKDPNRIFVQQPDGTVRSVRMGAHEMKKDIGKGAHYHLEEWDKAGNLIRPDQSVNILRTNTR